MRWKAVTNLNFSFTRAQVVLSYHLLHVSTIDDVSSVGDGSGPLTIWSHVTRIIFNNIIHRTRIGPTAEIYFRLE